MPDTVVVERAEWDRIRAECTALLDVHNMVRKLCNVVLCHETTTDEEWSKAAMEVQHFLRHYG